MPARSWALTSTVCLPAPKRREIRGPQKRRSPRSTLQTKTVSGSLERKRKTRRTLRFLVRISLRGCLAIRVRGALVST